MTNFIENLPYLNSMSWRIFAETHPEISRSDKEKAFRYLQFIETEIIISIAIFGYLSGMMHVESQFRFLTKKHKLFRLYNKYHGDYSDRIIGIFHLDYLSFRGYL